ncbi:MAG TPA: pitrilysin family protein, partial [candidate division Zixibacteria bacterium]|nr:pitrilysin family protein [candidate division Zixibacteria bacterium]
MRTERPKWKAALALAIALGAGASRASGQESLPVSPSKVERKNRAPVSEETIGVRLPRPREERLANGLSVLILEDHRLPVVFVQLHLRGAGALFDPEAFPGLASATAQMLREGTPGRTSREVAERLDRLGASVGAGAAFGSPDTVVTGSGLSENLDEWLEMIFEVLLEPVFPEDELRRLKERALVQLRQQRAAPRFLASERFHRAVFGDHPAAVVAPTQAAVETLTPELLARWHRERYNPAGSVLAVAGDVDGNRLLRALKSLLARWGGGRAAFEL